MSAELILNKKKEHKKAASRNALAIQGRQQIVECQKQIKRLMKPAERVWLNMTMLADLTSRAIDEGGWGSVHVDSGPGDLWATAGEVLSALTSTDSFTGGQSAWLALPMLPPLMLMPVTTTTARIGSFRMAQEALMALSVALKTDENQVSLYQLLVFCHDCSSSSGSNIAQ